MRMKTFLLATAASIAMLGATQAADMPVRKAPMLAPPPVALWTGLYVGVHGGVARHDWTFLQLEGSQATDLSFGHPEEIWTDSKTGALFGVHVGFNWQFGTLVAGLEADWSWTDLRRTITTVDCFGINCDRGEASTKIDGLATFRGRWGLAVDRTMAYFTGGLAVAQVKNGWLREKVDEGNVVGAVHLTPDKTRWGWVAGVGVEHLFSPNWYLRAELLFVDLGRFDLTAIGTGNLSGDSYSAAFTHQLTIARVGVGFKW